MGSGFNCKSSILGETLWKTIYANGRKERTLVRFPWPGLQKVLLELRAKVWESISVTVMSLSPICDYTIDPHALRLVTRAPDRIRYAFYFQTWYTRIRRNYGEQPNTNRRGDIEITHTRAVLPWVTTFPRHTRQGLCSPIQVILCLSVSDEVLDRSIEDSKIWALNVLFWFYTL